MPSPFLFWKAAGVSPVLARNVRAKWEREEKERAAATSETDSSCRERRYFASRTLQSIK